MGADKLDMKKFVRERDAALRSLDKKKITAYMDKYGIDWKPMNELVFWAAVHKARMSARGFTPQEKKISAQWLTEHGFIPEGVSPEEIIQIHTRRGMS